MHALLEQPCRSLPPGAGFVGVGIYALYYQGDFAAYGPVSSPNCETPIYVGRALPTGSRTGLGGLDVRVGRQLYTRLAKHAESITAVENLELDDFRCRYLIVDDIWIPLGESLLIARFQPVWNAVVHGFGLNDPGRHRYGGDRSDWDEIHPGRAWRDAMRRKRPATEILEEVGAHLTEGE